MSYCQKSLKITKILSIWKCLPSSPKSEREFSGDKLFCTNHVLLFEKKTHKKEITFGILVTNLKVPKFFSLQSFEKGRKFQYPRFFFFKIHLVKIWKDQERQYIIIFSTPVLYMYVVCKGKTLVYNRNITSFFTLKNFVILSLRRNSYLSNRNGFL